MGLKNFYVSLIEFFCIKIYLFLIEREYFICVEILNRRSDLRRNFSISAFSYAATFAFAFATENSWLRQVHPLNHLYAGEGSKARDEKRVTKRNVATRLGQTDGLGLIEIYSTLGNQELYILLHGRPRLSPGPLSHALLSRITPY